jgi:hypothetical protein
MSTTSTLQVPKLGRQKMAELASKAQSLGLTPERYVQKLIEQDLALDRKARRTTFAELMGPGREVDEAELDRLVDQARTRHHRKQHGKQNGKR